MTNSTTKSSIYIQDIYATAYIAASTLILAYSYLLHTVPILIFYAIWLPHLLFRGQFTLRPGRDMVMPLLFSGYCLFTIFWSGYSRITLVNGLEFISMIVCTIIVARTVSTTAMIKGFAIGTFLVLIPLFHTGHFSFEGLMGSKNMVGLYAEINIFVTLLLLFRLQKFSPEWIFFGIVPLLMGLLCMALSHSASSLVSLLGVLAAAIAACVLARMPQGLRPVALGIFLFGLATAAVFLVAFDINPQHTALHALGKNDTLTGRTWLWHQGYEIGMKAPLLGHGYGAFWVPGNPDAERMWKEFDISARTGFHFHNTFVQSFVDLGLIGVTLITIVILGNVLLALRRTIRDGADTETIFLLGIAVMFMIRAFVEVDFLGPFGIGVLLFYLTWMKLVRIEST